MDELDLRIRNHVYGSFVREGRVATTAGAAGDLELDEATVVQSFRRLHDAHALVLEPGGTRIRMLNPFSAAETPHRVTCDGREWFANCAWDALGVLAALQSDGHVDSSCPDCGEGLVLEVVGDQLARGEDLVVHFVVPARRWWEDIAFT